MARRFARWGYVFLFVEGLSVLLAQPWLIIAMTSVAS